MADFFWVRRLTAIGLQLDFMIGFLTGSKIIDLNIQEVERSDILLRLNQYIHSIKLGDIKILINLACS